MYIFIIKIIFALHLIDFYKEIRNYFVIGMILRWAGIAKVR